MLLQQECALDAIEFWFVPSFSCYVYSCQRFCERRESCLWLSEGPMGCGEQRQKIGPTGLCSRGANCAQALGELLDACLRLSCLLHQCHCLVASYPPLRRIPQGPQRPGSIEVALHTSGFPREERSNAVLLVSVERHPSLQVRV